METIKKNIFGQNEPYAPVILNEEQRNEVYVILQTISDQLRTILGDDTFLKEVSNIRATVQWVVGEVAKYLPDTIERVDGPSIESLVVQIIKDIKAEIASSEIGE